MYFEQYYWLQSGTTEVLLDSLKDALETSRRWDSSKFVQRFLYTWLALSYCEQHNWIQSGTQGLLLDSLEESLETSRSKDNSKKVKEFEFCTKTAQPMFNTHKNFQIFSWISKKYQKPYSFPTCAQNLCLFDNDS